jgi:parallel beta helix pectate lyase-like protein
MKRTTLLRTFLGASLVGMLYAAPAQAQVPRTWVSAFGDDIDPCSRTAPCKTFSRAHSVTAANGEINCIDPGGFGTVTITKSITIACEYTEGGVLAALTNGININAAGIIVVLRGLDIEGTGNGLVGVNILNAARVHIEKCVIHGFRGGAATGIAVNTGAGVNVRVQMDNTHITDNGNGITMAATGTAQLTADRVIVSGNSSNGIAVTANTAATFKNSVFSYNGAAGVQVTSGNGTINVYYSIVQNNITAVNVASTTGRVRVAHNDIHNNATAFTIAAGGVVESGGNNNVGNNGAGAPNGTIAQQ